MTHLQARVQQLLIDFQQTDDISWIGAGAIANVLCAVPSIVFTVTVNIDKALCADIFADRNAVISHEDYTMRCYMLVCLLAELDSRDLLRVKIELMTNSFSVVQAVKQQYFL